MSGTSVDRSCVRIAHVFKDAHPPVPAGITRYIADLAAASTARGADVDVYVAGVRHTRTDDRPDGVRIHRFSETTRALSMPLSLPLVNAARTIDADIIHLHLPNPIGELGAVANRGDHGLVLSFHAQLGKQKVLGPVYGPLQRSLVRKADRVLASSRTLMQAPELADAGERLRFAPYGVSPRMVAPEPGAFRPLDGPLRVLFVGRLVYYKGVEVLLDAIEDLPDVEVSIFGDGVLREPLEARLADDPALAARVRMRHDADDDEIIAAHLDHDVVVLPSVSRAEAFGLSMAEAMANGLPAISTSLGTGTDWVNLHDESGLVVPPNDAPALRAALESLRDDELRGRLAAGAVERARTVFSFDAHADQIHQWYEEAAS